MYSLCLHADIYTHTVWCTQLASHEPPPASFQATREWWNIMYTLYLTNENWTWKRYKVFHVVNYNLQLQFIMTALTSDAIESRRGEGVGSSPDPHKISIFYRRTRKLITFFRYIIFEEDIWSFFHWISDSLHAMPEVY